MSAPVVSEDELEGTLIPTYWSLWFLYVIASLLVSSEIGYAISIAWFGWNVYHDIKEPIQA